MPTGRAVCDSTSAPMLRLVAPSAIRTPISLVRCSTRYESTLNSPDNVRRSASAPSTSVSQNGIARRYAANARDGPQRGDLGHVGIDRREPIDERMARALGIAARTQRQRRLGNLGADRHVDTGARRSLASQPKARHIARDANDDEAAREKRRVWLPRRGPWAPLRAGVWLEPQDLPDGVDARPQLARDAFGHDRCRGACAPLVLREAASAHEIDAEDVEVLRRDELVRDGGLATRAVGKRGAPAQHARPRGRNRGDRRLTLHHFEDGARASARSGRSH